MKTIRDLANYETSTDFLRLWELAQNHSVICTVKLVSKFTDGTIHICRDIAHTLFSGGVVQVSVRGSTYVWADEKWDFVNQCEKSKVEWIVPHNAEDGRTEVRGSANSLVRPFDAIKFENGMDVTLMDDGSLRVLASGRGLNAITIHPSSDNCCRISPVGKLYLPNAAAHRESGVVDGCDQAGGKE